MGRKGWEYDGPFLAVNQRRPPGHWYTIPTRWERWRMRVRLAYLADYGRTVDIGEVQMLIFLTGARIGRDRAIQRRRR